MIETVINWVKENEQNGIKQHTQEWKNHRVFTIGGSSLAIIQGNNPYSNICQLISERIGLSKFQNDVRMQWGTLFENVIKRYVEFDKSCKIYGDDLYINGPPGTSYSPDGITVLEHNGELKIFLLEFKCPYSRIPTKSVPQHYIPQVKMGLDIIKIASAGLFVEGVFRRCTWEQLGDNALYDTSLVPRSSGFLPLAYGIIGFYFDADLFQAKYTDKLSKQKENLFNQYIDYYVELGTCDNGFMSNDIGECPVELFKLIMQSYEDGILLPWYGNIIYPSASSPRAINKSNTSIDQSLTDYTSTMRSGYINFGILPWKLFRVDYNIIEREDGYLAPWMPKIEEIVRVIRKCVDPINKNNKINIYNTYISSSIGGFSDE